MSLSAAAPSASLHHDELARILRQTEFSQLKLMRAETYAIQFSAESMGTGGP